MRQAGVDRALYPRRVEREGAHDTEPEVRHRRVGDELLDVVLGVCHQRPVHDPDHPQDEDPRPHHEGRVGEDRDGEPEESVHAELQQHPGQDHRSGGRGLDVRVGEPGVKREHRHLDRERQRERQEAPDLRVVRELELPDLDQVERVVAVGGLAVLHVKVEDRHQHQQRPHHGVEDELDRGVHPAVAAPHPDDEVHRDEHHLPGDVEQEQVDRDERPQHPGLEDEERDQELFHLLLDGTLRR